MDAILSPHAKRIHVWNRHSFDMETLLETNFPGNKFPTHLDPHKFEVFQGYENLRAAIEGVDLLVLCTTADAAMHMGKTLMEAGLPPDVDILSTAKGIRDYRAVGYTGTSLLPDEKKWLRTPSEALEEYLPENISGGCNFAAQLLSGVPTYAELDVNYAASLPKRMRARRKMLNTLNVHTLNGKPSDVAVSYHVKKGENILWVEVGGAVKNAYALAAGWLKEHFRQMGTEGAEDVITQLTRYLPNEMMAVYRRMADQDRSPRDVTYVPIVRWKHSSRGPSWRQDLEGTMHSDGSRNVKYGVYRARGMSHDEALAAVKKAVEGVDTAKMLLQYFKELNPRERMKQIPVLYSIGEWVEGSANAEETVGKLAMLMHKRFVRFG